MDPNATLEEMRLLIASIMHRHEHADLDRSKGLATEQHHDAARLAELAEGLDNWLSRGGSLPLGWQSRL